jgi:hypothetical protein
MPRSPTIDTTTPRVPAIAVLLLMPSLAGLRGTNEYPAINSTIPQPKYINIFAREVMAAALVRPHEVYNLTNITMPMMLDVMIVVESA